MAASITLNIQVNKAKATADIAAVEKAADAITKTPHVINFTTNGAQVVVKEAKSATTALMEATAAEQRRMKAEVEAEAARTRARASEIRELNRLSVEQEKTAQSANRLAIEQEKSARATQNAGSAASSAAGGWSILGSAIATAIGHLASRAIQYGLQKIRQGIREALTEMKNVDTELINISKVSGKTGDELKAIGDAAYDTASKYGVAASEYLKAVYAMQKAGMGDQSENMGELAVKTMLVGDTTQDVATKFLLAANAAWKLDGNMEKLGQIVDEADYINNNYATSLDKLAAGMPIVASVAAQAGMSAEETMAALGTITAATQESGTKAATALRALILNIEGQVGQFVTEEGEEIEVTAESVKSLQGLLEKYAKAEMDAAKAAGELIDPMTAIRALFKGMAEEDLNDVELFNLLSSMGGKLRTNQLTALVQNYEMFDKILGELKDSSGTADNEIGLMMDSWERKTQQLKNTWTEFVADIVDTDTVKGAIDLLTKAVETLDRGLDNSKKGNPFFDSTKTEEDIQTTTDKVNGLKDSIAELKQQDSYSEDTLQQLQDELEYWQAVLDLENAIAKAADDRYKEEVKRDTERLQRRLTQQYYDDLGRPIRGDVNSADTEARWGIDRAAKDIEFTGNIAEYQKALQGVVDTYKQYYDSVIQVRDVLGEDKLTDAQKEFIQYYEQAADVATRTDLRSVHDVDALGDAWYKLVDAEGNVLAVTKDLVPGIRETTEEVEKGTKKLDPSIAYLIDITGISTAIGLWNDSVAALDELDEAQKRAAESVDKNQTAQERYNEALKNYLEIRENPNASPEEVLAAWAEVEAAVRNVEGLADGEDLDNAADAFGDAVNQIQNAAEGSEDLGDGLGDAADEADATAAATVEIAPGITVAADEATRLAGELAYAKAVASGFPTLGLGLGFATGTKNAPGGPTLVNELGPELISEDGRAYIANGGRPGVVNLKRGAIVLTAKETQEALHRKTGSTKSINAASGGIVIGGDYVSVDTSQVHQQSGELSNFSQGKKGDNVVEIEFTEDSSKGKGKKGKGTGGGAASNVPAEKSLEDLAKETKDILSNLEKQAKLADNRGQYSKEADLYGQAQKEIDKMVARYKKAGYKETDDEILDLLNKRYDYEKKKETASQKTIKEAADNLKSTLGNLDKQAKLAEEEGNYLGQVQFYEKAQEEIAKMVEMYRKAGYKDDSDEILDLLQKNYDYAEKQEKVYTDKWNDLIKALESDTEAQELANTLAEKQQAVEEARLALENAQKNRTVRMYNAQTGQWEWVADQKTVKSAQESLTKAEKNYNDEVKDQAVKELQNMRDSGANLEDVVLGPALSAVALMAESSPEFQTFARALNAVYGVGSYLASTEGSSKVISTANDSHDTIYTFGNITLTEEQASSMSVAELARKLQVLKIS